MKFALVLGVAALLLKSVKLQAMLTRMGMVQSCCSLSVHVDVAQHSANPVSRDGASGIANLLLPTPELR